jgi:hypothetical protein
MKIRQFDPCFVEFIPAQLVPGRLYISMEYATVSHLCPCSCGNRVVTPLGQADWKIAFDGRVSMHPSRGNGQIPCRSHYFIRSDRVIWAAPMTREQTRRAQYRDQAALREQTPGETDRRTIDDRRHPIMMRIIAFLRPALGRSGRQ